MFVDTERNFPTLSKKHDHEILIATRMLFLPSQAITGRISRVNCVAMLFANKLVRRDNRIRSLSASMQIYLWNIAGNTFDIYTHPIRSFILKICFLRILQWNSELTLFRANCLHIEKEKLITLVYYFILFTLLQYFILG